MTDNNSNPNKDVHERLITVEQQQIHQKEALSHISETLDEVVKTQHILANQKREIEQVQSTVTNLVQQMNETQKNDAIKNVQSDQTKETVDYINKYITDSVNPELRKINLILKIGGSVISGLFAASMIWMKYMLGV